MTPLGEFAVPWGTPTGEFAVITVSLILTLLLGGVGWMLEVLLSWGETLLVKTWGAPSWISTPVGKSRDVISPLLSVGDERSRGALRLLSRLSDVGLLLGCIALRTLLRRVVGLLILARCLLTLEVRGTWQDARSVGHGGV